MAVLLLGDSHLARFRRFPRLVAPACTVRAMGGAAAADLLDQLGQLDPAGFDVIAVSVGTNDCGVRPATLPQFLDVMDAFVQRVAPTPVLMVNNPGADERAVDYDNARMRQYAEEAGYLVRSWGGSVLDIPSVIAPLGLRGRSADGIHVSRLGHLILVPKLRAALRHTSRSSG